MDKAKAKKWKWAAGIVVTVLLLWHLYRQIHAQLLSGTSFSFWPEGTEVYFIISVLLLPINLGLEALKWQRLVATASSISFFQALRSMMFGIAASLVTPNRIGEYPARIIQMKEHNSTRLLSVSVLGACSQMLALMIAGLAGLSFYYLRHPKPLYLAVLLGTTLFTLALATLYFYFERWAPRIEGIRWLRKLHLWGRLLYRFSIKEQVVILAISLLRFAVFTTQYWLLLRWQGIQLLLVEGFLMCTLFFWAMAIIPSIALAELGIRGAVSLFIFKEVSPNVAGIAAATFVLWCVNLMLPSLIGAAMFFRRGR